jgi:hypothetical protein
MWTSQTNTMIMIQELLFSMLIAIIFVAGIFLKFLLNHNKNEKRNVRIPISLSKTKGTE